MIKFKELGELDFTFCIEDESERNNDLEYLVYLGWRHHLHLLIRSFKVAYSSVDRTSSCCSEPASNLNLIT